MSEVDILAFGDNHGHVDTLERVVDATEGRTYDFIIHVGDITNACFDGLVAGRRQLDAIRPLFERLAKRGEVIYVFGNRDFSSGRKGVGTRVDRSGPGVSLPGTRIPGIGTIEVAGQSFTQVPEAVTDDSILVTHYDLPDWFDPFPGRLYLSGHAHVGRWLGNSVNTAFLYRDDVHGAAPLAGGFFEIELTDETVDVALHSFGGLTAYDCPTHGDRGTQYVPTDWAEPCRFCRDPSTV